MLPFPMRLLRNFLLLLSLSAAVWSSFAIVPAVGAVTVLAPAMRAMLARATEAAVSAVGTTSVRAAVGGTANIAGRSVGVTLARTMSVENMLLGVVGAGVVTASVSTLMDRSGVSLGAGGLTMDPGQAKVNVTQYCADAPSLYAGAPATHCAATYAGAIQARIDAFNAWKQGVFDSCPRTGGWTCTLEQARMQDPACSSGWCNIQRQTRTINYTGYDSTSAWNYWFQESAQSSSALGCPAGTTVAPWDANVCTTAAPHPAASLGAVVDRMKAAIQAAEVPVIAQDGADAGVENEPAVAPQTIEGPATVNLPSTTTTTTAPDGTVTEKVVTPVAHVTYEGDRITWNITTTTTTTVTAPGQSPVVTTETEGSTAGDGEPEHEVCGLPGKPPCKIDEDGTPTYEDTFPDPETVFGPLGGVPDVPDTSWSWSFQLPSSCSPIQAGTFGAEVVTIDMCQWQPMIHDILSMVWIIVTVWVSVGMVGRTITGA